MHDIVAILQVGFSGFAFLMAGYTYRLLKEQSAKSASDPVLLKAISRFMWFLLAMSLLTGGGKVGELAVTTWFTERVKAAHESTVRRSDEARACRAGLSRIVGADTAVEKTYDGLIVAIQRDSSRCASILDFLSKSKDSSDE